MTDCVSDRQSVRLVTSDAASLRRDRKDAMRHLVSARAGAPHYKAPSPVGMMRRPRVVPIVVSASDEEEQPHAVVASGCHSHTDGGRRRKAAKCLSCCAEHCSHTVEPADHLPASGPCRQSHSALALQHRASSLPLVQQPGSFDEQSDDTAKWWFYCPERHSQSWNVAKHHWGTAAWDIARSNSLFYHCLELYAWRKRAHLTGQVDRYVRQQNLLIRKVQAQIQIQGNGRNFEPLTLVAIGILAYVSMLDSNLDVAGLHLHAIKRLDPFKHFENFQHEWLYTIWVDLRYALLLRIHPVLAYFIPLAFRGSPKGKADDECELSARELAGRNSELSPHSKDFDNVESYSLFLRLHRLCREYSVSKFADNPPYGLIYDLEYRLRTLDAKEHQVDDQDVITNVDCVELFLAVVQLHVWILCRHCAPVSSYCRRHVLTQALKLLRKAPVPVLVAKWKSIADMSSLLWVLTTLTACSLEVPIDNDASILTALQYTLGTSSILTFDEISSSMRQWPWVDDWHSTKLQVVWEAIGTCQPLTAHSSNLLSPSSDWCFYVGAVEFYNS
ncbi:hypothetical protein Q7P37_008257 [Cladosporium fusiforme]